MIARALQRSGYRLINKQSKGGCWCREADFGGRVTKTTNGRMRLLEVPASLRPIRARAVALQKEWKDRRRGLARPVHGYAGGDRGPRRRCTHTMSRRESGCRDIEPGKKRTGLGTSDHRAAKKAEPASSRPRSHRTFDARPIDPAELSPKGIRATRAAGRIQAAVVQALTTSVGEVTTHLVGEVTTHLVGEVTTHLVGEGDDPPRR